MLPLEMLDKPGSRRPEAADPVHFFGAGARRRKNAIGELPQRGGVVWLVDGEASHQHAADSIGAFAVFVFPRLSIARGGRQHFDVVAQAQLLGEQPAGMLGASCDLAAVSRRDESKLHAIAPGCCGADLSGPRSKS